jgi:hypothetical protein
MVQKADVTAAFPERLALESSGGMKGNPIRNWYLS